MSVPYLRVTRRNGKAVAVCGRGVIVHCFSRLGAAVAVLTAKLPCSERVFTQWALELAKAVHHFDGVMSHSSKFSRLFRYDLELKLPSPCPICKQQLTKQQTTETVPCICGQYVWQG
jgi:hypothetical protein